MSSTESSRRPAHLFGAAVALVAAAILLLGGPGTLARWSDTATVTPGSFTTGTLEIRVDGADGAPTAYRKTNLALTGMVPGESVAATLQVTNTGDAPFTFTQTIVPGTAGLSPALRVAVFADSTQTGDDASYPRTEGCTSQAALLLSGDTSRRLEPGATVSLCVRVTLPLDAPDSTQDLNGELTLRLDARQVR